MGTNGKITEKHGKCTEKSRKNKKSAKNSPAEGIFREYFAEIAK